MNENKIEWKKVVFYFLPFVAIVALIVVGAKYDFQISEKVAVLQNGEYYSPVPFLRFFEQVGQMPVYLFVAFALACLLRALSRVEKKWLKITLAAIFLGLLLVDLLLMTEQNLRYYANLHGTSEWHQENKSLAYAMSFVLILVPFFLPLFFANKVKGKTVERLAFFAVLILVAAAFSQLATQGIKILGGRLRYRALYVLTEAGYSDQAIFYPLFHFAPSKELTSEMISLGLTKDIFKSFPSGHATSGSMFLCLGFLPAVLEWKGRKKRVFTAIFWSVGVLLTLLIAGARVFAGAHYFTDVLFGATFGYLGVLLGAIVVWLLEKYFLSREAKEKLNQA